MDHTWKPTSHNTKTHITPHCDVIVNVHTSGHQRLISTFCSLAPVLYQKRSLPIHAHQSSQTNVSRNTYILIDPQIGLGYSYSNVYHYSNLHLPTCTQLCSQPTHSKQPHTFTGSVPQTTGRGSLTSNIVSDTDTPVTHIVDCVGR